MPSRRILGGLGVLPLLARIVAAAAGQRLYLTGGFLRDRLSGRTPKSELDLTLEDPRALVDRLTLRRSESCFLIDRDRHTYRLVFPPPAPLRWADLTRMRSGSIEEDLCLRDFTVNALAVELGRKGAVGPVLDPTGGLSDIARARLRPCSSESFRDDPLRVLRGVRFEAGLGFRPDGKTLRLMASWGGSLRTIAPERVRDEFFQILQGAAPVRGMRRVKELRLLRHLGPPFGGAGPASLKMVGRAQRLLDALSPRSAAARTLAEPVDQVATRRGMVLLAALLLDNDAARRLPVLVRRLALGGRAEESLRICLDAPLSPAGLTVRQRWGREELLELFHSSDAAVVEAVLLSASRLTPAAAGKAAASAFLARYRRMRRVFLRPSLLNGKEALAALPVSPGPDLGRLLRQARRAQDLGKIRTSRGALQWARKNLEGRTG